MKRRCNGAAAAGSPGQDPYRRRRAAVKDLNGNGELDPYEDWRLSPAERAADLVAQMTVDEKVGMMLINSRFTGYQVEEDAPTSAGGPLDERTVEAGTAVFVLGTSYPTTPLGGDDCRQCEHHVRCDCGGLAADLWHFRRGSGPGLRHYRPARCGRSG